MTQTVHFFTDPYVSSHQKQPRGRGTWEFTAYAGHDRLGHSITTPSLTFSEAKRCAATVRSQCLSDSDRDICGGDAVTEEQIERHVETRTNSIDRRYLAGEMTEAEYQTAMAELNAWAEAEYANGPGHVQTTCIEHAYGTTQRLSFQIKVF